MAKYVIGDIQGCFSAFMQLLKKIQFDPNADEILFCGDLVNRGGQSLEMLRWAYSHQFCSQTVLGNHDLSLLAKYFSEDERAVNKEQKQVFQASDAEILMQWLLKQPLLIEKSKYIIVHAGIYPLWSMQQAVEMARFVEKKLSKNPIKFLHLMFGNKPNYWSESISKNDAFRFAVNAFTRMRYVDQKGALDLQNNGDPKKQNNLTPWFDYGQRVQLEKHVIFGHWSALGLFQSKTITCLDSGKVWGRKLTAMRLRDQQIFQV